MEKKTGVTARGRTVETLEMIDEAGGAKGL